MSTSYLQVGLVYLDICMHVDHNLDLFSKSISKNFTQVFVEYAIFLNFDLFSHELPLSHNISPRKHGI